MIFLGGQEILPSSFDEQSDIPGSMRHNHRSVIVLVLMLAGPVRANAQPEPTRPNLLPLQGPRPNPRLPEPHVGPYVAGANRPCPSGELCNEIHWNFEPAAGTTRGSGGNLQGWLGSGPFFRR